MSERVLENATAAFKLTVDHRARSNGVLPPLAVILGFLGCSERVARSLSRSFHVATGYNTAWTVPPAEVTFSATLAPKIAFARALADALSGQSDACGALGKGGIVLVSFSNSGAYVVETLYELLSAPHASASYKDLLEQIAGVVFDSGPCSVSSPLLGAEALLAGRKDRTLPEYSVALARSCLFSVGNLLRTGSAGGKFSPGKTSVYGVRRRLAFSDRSLVYKGMRYQPETDDSFSSSMRTGALLPRMQSVQFPRAAELFVYSRDDPLCDFRALQEFIHERKMRPRDTPVLELSFDKSSHCGHLRLHFKEYAENIAALHKIAVEPWRRNAQLQPWTIPPTAKL